MTKALLFLTIVCLPLYVLRTKILGIPTTALELLIALTTISWLFTQIRSGVRVKEVLRAFKTPLLFPSLLFLGAGLVSVFVNQNWVSGFGIYRAYFLEPFLLFNLIYFEFKKDYSLPLLALITSGWVVSLPALGQLIFHTALFPAAAHEISQGRVAGFYNSANSLALYLGPVISLLPVYYLAKKQYYRLITFTSGVVFLLVFLCTKSVGGLVGLSGIALLFLIYFLVRNRPVWGKRMFQVLVVLFLTGTLGFIVFLFNISAITPKIGIVYPRPYESTSVIRLCLWEGARNMLLSHPLLGVGLNNFPKIYESFRTCDSELLQYPHNIFLNFWAETGLLGLIGFFGLLSVFYKKVTKAKISGWIKVGLVGVLVYILVHGMFDVSYFKNDLSSEFWVFLALGLLAMEQAEASGDSGK